MTIFPSFFVNKTGGYEIEQSLRFDGSSYLTHTHGSTPTGDNGTLSVWVKRRGTNYNYDTIIEGLGSGGRRAHYLRGFSGTDGRIDMHQWFPDDGGIDGGQVPDAQLRDPSAWYHLLWQHQNSSTRSVSDRLWINGVEQTDITTPGNHNAQPWEVTRNSATATIGRYGGGYGYLHGYIAEMHCIDGSLVAADQFGEYDANGVWCPKRYTGSYGTNGFYLKFDPSATNGIGHDHSGNGNHFTANNFTTSGTGTDVMSDTPTTNWATLNPLGGSFQTRHTLSEGNLVYTQSASTGNAATMNSQGTIGVSSGKWYWEISNATNQVFGFMQSQNEAGNYQTTGGWVYSSGTDQYGGVTGFSHSNSIGSSDVIGMALDMDNNTCACYKNNSLMGTFTTIPDGTYFPTAAVFSSGSSGGATYNFGQRAFTYTPPTGFKALNTSNLPAPTVKDGSKYFNTLLWSGDGASSRALTGVGFQPEMTWIKARNQGYSHQLFDAVRGAGGNSLQPNLTAAEGAEGTGNGYLSSFDSDGFTVDYGTNGFYSNRAGTTYVAWSWDAGGSGSSNTDGTITSTVSANPTAGFSIVSYTGTGSAATVGHGLGVAPSFYVVKNRDGAYFWPCYHASLTNAATTYIGLNETTAEQTGETHWNSTAPTSTVFSVNTQLSVNNSGDKYIAYCFAEVEGYSKFGIFSGNYNADGNFLYTGFTPAFVMLKNAERSGTDWVMVDTARDTYNYAGRTLRANTSADEDTRAEKVDILSNGFKLRTTDLSYNGPDGNPGIIYIAFASNPFGGSGVSPATAR